MFNHRSFLNWFAGALCLAGAAFAGCSGGDQTNPTVQQSSASLQNGNHHRPPPGHRHHRGDGDDDQGSASDAGTGTDGSTSGGGFGGAGGSTGGSGTGTGGSTTGGSGGMSSGGSAGYPGTGGSSGYDVCGDGFWGYSEQCDDGNTISGDGCSATCTVEAGYSCWSGTCHLVVCGDGLIDWYLTPEGYYTSEGCDDGNAISGDGCSAMCQTEAGWVCTDAGQPCRQPTCGDGYQDYIFVPGDGTSLDGGTAGGAGSGTGGTGGFAETGGTSAGGVVGTGGITSSGGSGGTGGGGYYIYEQCDDGNTTSGDGCSSTCEVEPGWYCPQPGTACRQPTCGDGYQDYIFVPGDGGGSSIDGGTIGTGGGGIGGASAVAIDGSAGGVAGAGGSSAGGTGGAGGGGYYIYEQCDDGNTISGDGCSSTCEVEPGWYCPEPNTPCRQPICGNGYIDPIFVPFPTYDAGAAFDATTPGTGGAGGSGGYYTYEQCDDGNTISGDGCSTTCTIE